MCWHDFREYSVSLSSIALILFWNQSCLTSHTRQSWANRCPVFRGEMEVKHKGESQIGSFINKSFLSTFGAEISRQIFIRIKGKVILYAPFHFHPWKEVWLTWAPCLKLEQPWLQHLRRIEKTTISLNHKNKEPLSSTILEEICTAIPNPPKKTPKWYI